MPSRVYTRLSQEEVTSRLAALPMVLSGRQIDTSGAVDDLKLAVGIRVLALIKEDYENLSEGGASEMGFTWELLQPSTIKSRTGSKSPTAKAVARLERAYQDAPDHRKRSIARNRKRLREATSSVSVREKYNAAKAMLRSLRMHMTQTAYDKAEKEVSKLKKLSAKERRAELAASSVLILRDTGRGYNSLTVAKNAKQATNPDTVLVTLPNGVKIGTNVEYMGYHQSGTSKMPARPFMPDIDHPMPERWRDVIVDEIKSVISSAQFMNKYLS